VILIDDSASMSTHDDYRDPKVREAAENLAKKADLSDDEKAELARYLASTPGATPANRLRLTQTFLAKDEEYLRELLYTGARCACTSTASPPGRSGSRT